MSETPRTDAIVEAANITTHKAYALELFAKELEREITSLKSTLHESVKHIQAYQYDSEKDAKEIESLKSQLEQAQGKIKVYEKLIRWLPELKGYDPEDIGLCNVNLYNRDIVACRAALERSKE
jgi:hypothetical protein